MAEKVKKVLELEVDVNTGEVTQLNRQVDGVGKGLDKANKGVGSMSKGFKGVGMAIKAAGIGLLIGVLAKLTDLFGQNQKVVDGFSTAMNALSIAFNDFFSFISDNIGTVTDYFKDLFENPGDKLKEIATTIKDYVIKNVQLLISGFGKLGEAMSFLFDGEFEKAFEVGKEGALEMGEALLKLNPATAVVANLAEAVYDNRDAISAYTKSLWENGEALVDNQKQLQLLEIETRRLQLANQKAAEDQRQIRDDVTKSFEERIAANEKLGQILEESVRIEQDAVRQRIAILQNEQTLLGATFERQLEIKNLEVELLDIEERLGGVRSEQLTNQNALLLEQKQLQEELAQKNRDEISELTDYLIAQTERELERERKAADEKIKLAEDVAAAKEAIAFESLNAIAAATDAVEAAGLISAKRAFQINKAIAITEATINGIAAVQKTLKEPAYPAPFNLVMAGVMGATTIANVARIASTQFNEGATGGASRPSVPRTPGASPNAPAFNTVGNSATNQLSQSIAAQNQRPTQAYVVANDVSTAQSLERNRQRQASFP